MPNEPRWGEPLPKSRTVSARLSPYTFYSLLLLSRAQRRTLSDVLEWCIHSNIKGHEIPGRADPTEQDLAWIARETWSTNDLERIVKLGIVCPELLDFEEANIFRVLEGTPELWSEDSARDRRKVADFLWDKVENRLTEVEMYANESADKYPVTGLSDGQIRELGWELSPKRHQSKKR